MNRGSQFLVGLAAAVLTFVTLNLTLGERPHRLWGHHHGWHSHHNECDETSDHEKNEKDQL